MAVGLYRSIGRKILRKGRFTYWTGRAYLEKLEKWSLMLHLLLLSKTQRAPPQRDVVACDLSRLRGVPGYSA